MTGATWGLVGVTFLLVLVAGWYAWETRRLVDRTDKEREARERPMLAVHLVPWEAQLMKLRIQNVGPGAAFEISGAIEGVSAGRSLSFPWAYPLLAPGKYEEFGFPTADKDDRQGRFQVDKIRERFETIRAKFTYKAGTGKEYELDKTINIRDITDAWLEARMMATQDHAERLGPRIAKALDKMADSVGKMRDR